MRWHTFEITLCCIVSRVLAGNRMVTCVLAKTTKVKNNFVNGKKKFKRILSRLFDGRRKVQVTNLPSRTSSLLSVLLRTRSAQRLSSQHFAAVPELVSSVFFCPKPWFLRRYEHIFAGKHQHFHVDRHLVTRKEINSKINFCIVSHSNFQRVILTPVVELN